MVKQMKRNAAKKAKKKEPITFQEWGRRNPEYVNEMLAAGSSGSSKSSVDNYSEDNSRHRDD